MNFLFYFFFSAHAFDYYGKLAKKFMKGFGFCSGHQSICRPWLKEGCKFSECLVAAFVIVWSTCYIFLFNGIRFCLINQNGGGKTEEHCKREMQSFCIILFMFLHKERKEIEIDFAV